MNTAIITLSNGKKAAVQSAEYELRPGIAASVGRMRMPVKLDSIEVLTKIGGLEGLGRGQRIITQRRRGENRELAVMNEAPSNSVPDGVELGGGTLKLMDAPNLEANTQAADGTWLLASELLRHEFDLTLTSLVEQQDKEHTHSITIKRLRVSKITPVTPAYMNQTPLCDVVFTDRRIDWAKMENFTDSINAYKQIGPDGVLSYWPDSCFNPSASEADRRPWSLREYLCYLLCLMGEAVFANDRLEYTEEYKAGKPVVTGTRGNGFDFSEMGQFFSANFGQIDSKIEGMEGDGLSPAYLLERAAKRYGFTVFFTHQSKPLLCPTAVEPKLPVESVEAQRMDTLPHFDNIYNIRSRDIAIKGPALKVQETFSLQEGIDFDYVTPFRGQWRLQSEIWGLAGENIGGGDLTILAILASQSFDGDIDKFYHTSWHRRAGSNTFFLEAINALANTAFRYIRLRRSGIYGTFRKPLESLLSMDSRGGDNYPLVLAKLGYALKFRASIQDATEDIVRENHQAVENATRLYLVDTDALVFKANEALVFPTSARLGGVEGALRETVTRKFQHHTAYEWYWNDTLRAVIASELVHAESGRDATIPNDAYSFTFTNGEDNADVSRRQPPLVKYRDEFKLGLVLAEMDYAADGTPLVLANGNELRRLDNSNDSGLVVAGSDVLGNARNGVYGEDNSQYVREVDGRAASIIREIAESFTAENAVDIEFARIYQPIGHASAGERGPDTYQYNAYLGSVMWTVGDDGCMTTMRFGSNRAFTGMTTETERAVVEYLGQRTAEHQLSALSAFKAALGRRNVKEERE